MKRAEIEAKMNQFYADAARITDKAKAENRDITDAELLAVESACDEGKKAKDELAAFDARAARLERAMAGTGRKTQPDAIETAATSNLKERAQDNPTRGYDGYGGFGRFALDVYKLHTQQGLSDGLKIVMAAGDGMEAGLKADGGVLLPPAFSTTIQDKVGMESDSLMAETDMLPALPYGVESMEFPVVNETSRADGSRSGGIQGRWKAELTQMSESKPKLKDVKLEPQQLYALCYVADKLLQNAPQLEAFLSGRVADEFNFKIGDSIINGTGSGQPRGILTGATDAPRVQIAKESGQAAATIVTANLEKMYARMPGNRLAGAKWYVNQDVLPQLFSLTKAVGTGGVPVFMPGNNISGAPFGTIYGNPIKITEYNATLGTEGDIIFANMKQYATITRGTVQSAMSIHLKFDFNQTAFRFITEVDGQPWISSSITPFKGSNKLSPFVTLQTRS